ncbi:PX domain protein [Aspergillus desertorum]
MAPANEETGRVPWLQPLPAPPHPPSTIPSAPDCDGYTVDPAGSEPSEISTNPSPASPSHFQSESPCLAPNERPDSGIVPPYWSHHRNASRASQISTDGGPAITLEDHTEDPNCETNRGLWAKSVTIDDHVVVQGKSGVGAYVVWNCKIRTLEGGMITVRMRYSEFDDLRLKLAKSFPHARNALPSLPPKSVLFKFRPSFLESRKVGLEYFLNCVLLNPEFSSSPIVKDFLFGRTC